MIYSLKTSIPESIRIQGALDFDTRKEGLGVRRLPAWTRSQVPEGLDVMLRMPSGVRVQFQTDAVNIGLESLVTAFEGREAVPMNLQVGDQLWLTHIEGGNRIRMNDALPSGFEIVRGEPSIGWFDDLPEGQKKCEIWLPHNAFVTLRALHLKGGSGLLKSADQEQLKWSHYGSSISHCMEADEPAKTWPAVAARLADISLMSFGFGGQCHMDQFVARALRDQDADLISLKIGINIVNIDSMRERVFIPAIHGFLDTLREKQPDTPIVLISPIFCPGAETKPGPTIADQNGKFVTVDGFEHLRMGALSLIRVREILEEVVETRRNLGDLNLDYFNGLELFGEEDAHDLPDDLHPNPIGYQRMGERFFQKYLDHKLAQL